jgi:hypothetical protein
VFDLVPILLHLKEGIYLMKGPREEGHW